MNWTIHQKIDLQGQYKQHYVLDDELLVPGDNGGHVWEIEVMDGGVPANLSGYSCQGKFMRADGAVPTVTGSISGNVVRVKFSSSVYVYPGQLRAVVLLTKGSEVVAICETYFFVSETLNGNGAIIVPADEIVYTPTRQIVYQSRRFMDTSDSTATVDDVRSGKTFYDANGEKRTGNANMVVDGSGTATAVLISGDDYRIVYS